VKAREGKSEQGLDPSKDDDGRGPQRSTDEMVWLWLRIWMEMEMDMDWTGLECRGLWRGECAEPPPEVEAQKGRFDG
jgi:hypothetical protein